MPNSSALHTAAIVMDLPSEDFGNVMRSAAHHSIREVVADLETAYRSRGLSSGPDRGVQITINIDYSMRELGPSDPDARYSNADIAREIDQFRAHVARPHIDRPARRSRAITDRRTDTAVRSDGPTVYAVAAGLLGFLPVLDVNDLVEEKRSCPVCTECFSGSDAPLLLNCRHVVGRACIGRWILSGHNSCPLCRSAIFEPAR